MDVPVSQFAFNENEEPFADCFDLFTPFPRYW